MTTSIVPRQLLANGFTLNQVDDMVHDGRVTEAEANLWFQVWCKGKTMHRWNATTGKPEHDVMGWREMRWG